MMTTSALKCASLPSMDCVCGCGRKIPKSLADQNYVAAAVALELLVWDRDRATRGIAPDGREALLARGVECYALILDSLHEEGSGDAVGGCKAWIEESSDLRSDRTDMTEKSFLGARPPKLSKEDMERLDPRHPELSFTGGIKVVPIAGATPTEPDLIDNLERLQALRDAKVLTEAEFTSAKARLPKE